MEKKKGKDIRCGDLVEGFGLFLECVVYDERSGHFARYLNVSESFNGTCVRVCEPEEEYTIITDKEQVVNFYLHNMEGLTELVNNVQENLGKLNEWFFTK